MVLVWCLWASTTQAPYKQCNYQPSKRIAKQMLTAYSGTVAAGVPRLIVARRNCYKGTIVI